MKTQTRIFYLIQFVTSFALGTILPVYVLYFRHHQLDLFQIALVAAIFEASILLFEMPTGLIADIYGRKISVVLSMLTLSIAGGVFILFPSILGFIIAEIISGLGETLKSGALEAWVVDSLKHQNQENKIKHVFASGTRFSTGGRLLGLILGGYVGSLNINLIWYPFLFSFLFCWIFLWLKMKEEYQLDNSVRSEKASSPLFQKTKEMINQSFQVIKTRRTILALILLGLFSSFSYETISQYWQVHFSEDLNIPTSYFGWIVAISSVVVILLVNLVMKLSEKFKKDIWFLILLESFFMLSLLFIALAYHPLLAIALYISLESFQGFKQPIFLDIYNRDIPSPQRATLLSFQNLVSSLGEVLAGLTIGVIALKFGLRITFSLGAMVLLSGIALFIFIHQISFGKKL